MRGTISLAASLLVLSACSGDDMENGAAPMPNITEPAQRTPGMNVTPAEGESPDWMDPPAPKGDPTSAPYGNLLDAPLVKGPDK